MVVLAIYATLMVHMGEGPDKIEASDAASQTCRDYWWTNLLYINNLYPFPGSVVGGQVSVEYIVVKIHYR